MNEQEEKGKGRKEDDRKNGRKKIEKGDRKKGARKIHIIYRFVYLT
jgi:hypothetical protein